MYFVLGTRTDSSSTCGALADEGNEPHAWRPTDEELTSVYAEATVVLARPRREELVDQPGTEVHVAVIDHLIERVRQTKAGEVSLLLADVVDRLHAEALRELACT